jgi:hypothetical protein
MPQTAATNILGGCGVSGTAATHCELEPIFFKSEMVAGSAGRAACAIRLRQSEQSHHRGQQFS